MNCAHCQATVPDESTFCLRCGRRVVPMERLAPVNGGKEGPRSTAPPVPSRPAAVGTARPTAGPGSKDAYALSFQRLTDAGVRSRVARWLCEVAPAHHARDVQAGLAAGGFATVLALTPAEADATRARIQALGAHPAFWQLRPATVAELLLPERPRTGQRTPWTTQHKVAAGLGLLVFVVCVIFSWTQYTRITTKTPPRPGEMPRIGARP